MLPNRFSHTHQPEERVIVDVNAIASAATAMSEAKSGQAVQMAVLKKALDLQGQGAIQLVQAAVLTPGNNPSHLGNQINTFA